MFRSKSQQNLMEHKKRPLSQSLSINNLHKFTFSKSSSTTSTVNTNVKTKTTLNSKTTNNVKLSNHTKSSKPVNNTNNSRTISKSDGVTKNKRNSMVFTTSNEVTINHDTLDIKQTKELHDATIKPINKEKELPIIKEKDLKNDKKRKRFSLISFMQPDESDSSPSPLNSIMDNTSINLQPIELDDDTSIESQPNDDYNVSIESKKRTSNLSNIIEFFDMINYDDLNRESIKLESSVIHDFNLQSDTTYKVQQVSNVLLFGYEQVDTLALDDINYWDDEEIDVELL